jgi:DNA polymerase-3 subunit epsilon
MLPSASKDSIIRRRNSQLAEDYMSPDTPPDNERVIFFDTETTGFYAKNGDRIVEIGCVEVIGNVETGRTFHRYINPGSRQVDPGALEVHGLSNEFLSKYPKFREVYQDFLDFIGDSTLIAHNAPFDMGFLEAEFALLGRPKPSNKVVDTVRIARLKYPGQKNSLDALCTRLGVDKSARDLHGALIDSSLLARVYVKMLGLDRLSFAHESADQMTSIAVQEKIIAKSALPPRPPRPVITGTEQEIESFNAFIAANVKNSIWSGILSAGR